MLETTNNQIYSIRQMVDAWKRDHADAKAESQGTRTFKFSLQELEALLKDAVLVKIAVEKMHRQWIESVTSGAAEPDLNVDIQFHRTLKLWFTSLCSFRELIGKLAEDGIKLRHSDKLLNHLKWAEEVLAITKEPVTAVAPIRPSTGSRFVDVSRYDD